MKKRNVQSCLEKDGWNFARTIEALIGTFFIRRIMKIIYIVKWKIKAFNIDRSEYFTGIYGNLILCYRLRMY